MSKNVLSGLLPQLHGTVLRIAQVLYLVISVLIIIAAGMFACKLIGVVGPKTYMGMALTALTMQTTALLFSNGTVALLSALMLIYGLLSLTMKRKVLYLYDVIIILSIIFIILDNQIFVFFRSMWIWMLVLWVLHRIVLGLTITGRKKHE